MFQLKEIVANILATNTEYLRTGSGIAAWICWENDLDNSIEQSFQDYGGTALVRGANSGVWFFFTTDAFLAFARVQLWAKLNSINLSITLMPAETYLSDVNKRLIKLRDEFLNQECAAAKGFNLWAHPEVAGMVTGMPGLVFEEVPPPAGLASGKWLTAFADTRLSYRTGFGWYCVLCPLGNPLEKSFQTGWHNFFVEMEQILQRQKLKYTLNNNFLLFPLDTLSQLKTWCKDYFALIARLKNSENSPYWPTIQAIVDKKGLAFNNELPKKVALDWDQLTPDFPHMNYRNAYLLGEDFSIHNVRFEAGEGTLEDWCNISIKEEGSHESGVLPVAVPVRLVTGKEPHCFYCGLRNHRPATCPSRLLPDWEPGVWKKVSGMNFSDMNQALRKVDLIIKEEGEPGIVSLLTQGDAPENTMVQAVFEIGSLVQLHMLPRIWLSRSKDCPRDFFNDQSFKEDHPIWAFLEKMSTGELIPLEKELHNIMQNSPRDYRLLTLNGFLALEREDPIRAASLWKEAEGAASTSLQQGHIKFLQARLLEIEGKYELAGTAYSSTLDKCPEWLEPRYRQVICSIKMGFPEVAVGKLLDIIQINPSYFNKSLLDPEMERGHIQVLSALFGIWQNAETRVPEEISALRRIFSELGVWFGPEHPFYEKLSKYLERNIALAGVANYVPYQSIIRARSTIEKELQNEITVEARDLRNTFKVFRQRIIRISEEAAWFPFPRLLKNFTRTSNLIIKNTTWALKANLNVSEVFNKAKRMAETGEVRLKKLEGQIKFLKVVRDSTLFSMLMLRTFLWGEIIALLLVFLGLPLLLYYGGQGKLSFLSDYVFKQQWDMQKGLIIVLTLFVIAISVIKTSAVFEKRRNNLLEKYKKNLPLPLDEHESDTPGKKNPAKGDKGKGPDKSAKKAKPAAKGKK